MLLGDPCVHLPRTKKQSAGLFFAACGRPSCSIPRTEAPKKLPSLSWGAFSGDPCGNRTHVNGVRGRCLNRLTNGPYKRSRHLPIFTGRFQPTIFGTSELNFCVRNGNRWNLTVIDTGQRVTFVMLLFLFRITLSCYPVKGCTLKTEYRTAFLANRVSDQDGVKPSTY